MFSNIASDELVPSDDLIASQRIGQGNFIEIGENLVDWYVSKGFISNSSIILDIGCGLGRIARPLIPLLKDMGTYYGFDNNKCSIKWCREKYAGHINFNFQWIDVHSKFYNPESSTDKSTIFFPLPNDYVDFINLTSVFTHMKINHVRTYLLEISRMLKPGKYCYITYFLVDQLVSKHFKESVSLGKWHPIDSGYMQDPDCPEKVILLDEDVILQLYSEAGLTIKKVTYGSWCKKARGKFDGGYQDAIIAFKNN
ncbi:MAG: class I SAM-dependent methyltransferase [Methylococcaceae bacterium]